jgi:ATP-binding cassette subfamily B protein
MAERTEHQTTRAGLMEFLGALFRLVGTKTRETLRLKRAVGLVWRAGPGWCIANGTIIAAQAMLPLALLYLIKLIVDGLTQASLASAAGDAPSWIPILWLVMGAGGVAVGLGLMDAGARLVTEAQGQVVADFMFSRIHEKATTVDLAYYEEPQHRDTLRLAQQTASQRPREILSELLGVSRNGASLLVMAGLLASFHWAVLPLMLVAALPAVLLRLRYSADFYSWERRATPDERLASYYILNTEAHAMDLRLFGIGSLFRQRFVKLRTRLRRERIRRIRNRSVADFLGEFTTIVGVFLLLGLMARAAVLGEITVGDLVMYFTALQRGGSHLGQTLRGISRLYENNLFLADLYKFLDMRPTIVDPPHPQPIPRPIQQGIVFDNVTFQYPTGHKPALRDVSAMIEPGEHVALVGHNGSGKSTFVKLLCRLYDTTEGAVTVDGTDLRQFSVSEWRRQLGVLMQQYSRYDQTAAENIWFGNIELDLDDPRIAQAARETGAHDVIEPLPKGYESLLGHRFRDGHQLSGGQWQKVALARLYVRDAQLLILDEPTSAMDPEAEAEALRNFEQLAAGRTTIVISHRLSAVRSADTIYMMGEGRILERGSHDELIRMNGEYARLYDIQARKYRD